MCLKASWLAERRPSKTEILDNDLPIRTSKKQEPARRSCDAAETFDVHRGGIAGAGCPHLRRTRRWRWRVLTRLPRRINIASRLMRWLCSCFRWGRQNSHRQLPTELPSPVSASLLVTPRGMWRNVDGGDVSATIRVVVVGGFGNCECGAGREPTRRCAGKPQNEHALTVRPFSLALLMRPSKARVMGGQRAKAGAAISATVDNATCTSHQGSRPFRACWNPSRPARHAHQIT
jgi:hypothetical protein